jgi:general secretion pathway protein G
MKMRKSTGFSLIELVVTLAILSILGLMTIPLAENASRRAKEGQLRESLQEIRHAIDSYKNAYDEGKILNSPELSGYPPSLEILVNGVPNQRDTQRKKIYFLRRMPIDPFNASQREQSNAWGKRSYTSEADDPKDGVDIYDVYSKSDMLGLNGVPYKKW